jgi:hypothetical protein
VECPATKLIITSTTGSDAGITLSGTAKAIANGQNMTVWADACNTAGQCVRKTKDNFNVASSGTAQSWELTWTKSELPAGDYKGTIWVGLTAGTDNLSAQSGEVGLFTISSVVKTFEATVIRDKAFSLSVGAISSYDLGTISLSAVNNGVTASEVGGKLVLSSTSGLANTTTTATFGNTQFVITAIDQPKLAISNVSFE